MTSLFSRTLYMNPTPRLFNLSVSYLLICSASQSIIHSFIQSPVELWPHFHSHTHFYSLTHYLLHPPPLSQSCCHSLIYSLNLLFLCSLFSLTLHTHAVSPPCISISLLSSLLRHIWEGKISPDLLHSSIGEFMGQPHARPLSFSHSLSLFP